jgi:hypothetical protein
MLKNKIPFSSLQLNREALPRPSEYTKIDHESVSSFYFPNECSTSAFVLLIFTKSTFLKKASIFWYIIYFLRYLEPRMGFDILRTIMVTQTGVLVATKHRYAVYALSWQVDSHTIVEVQIMAPMNDLIIKFTNFMILHNLKICIYLTLITMNWVSAGSSFLERKGWSLQSNYIYFNLVKAATYWTTKNHFI